MQEAEAEGITKIDWKTKWRTCVFIGELVAIQDRFEQAKNLFGTDLNRKWTKLPMFRNVGVNSEFILNFKPKFKIQMFLAQKDKHWTIQAQPNLAPHTRMAACVFVLDPIGLTHFALNFPLFKTRVPLGAYPKVQSQGL